MWGRTRSGLAGGAVALVALLAAPALGQQTFGQPSAAQQRAPSKSPAATSRPAAKEDPAAGRGGSEAQLRQRVEQLEEQIVDMQVALGTLESLAKSPGSSGAAAPVPRGGQLGDIDQARIDSLETQIRALTNQLEQLAEQVRQMAGRRTDAGPPPGRDPLPELARPGDLAANAGRPPAGGGFGSTTVTPGGGRDPIGRMIDTQPEEDRTASAAPAAAHAGNPKELYETAYGYLLQQDYGAAEVAFEEFLRIYPQDRLAPDAQYWLGESLYVQRRYKQAAQAFLKVVQNYQGSSKVPGSLLKLAMTLEQLGQKDCALFSELDTRHPNASADIKSKAKVVRQRVGC
jgi:tol-pal system protein YbgF